MVKDKETIAKELKEISDKRFKYFLQFTALCSTTSEFLSFCKDDLIKINRLQGELKLLQAPNRRVRKELESTLSKERKEFEGNIKRLLKILTRYSKLFEEDPKYTEFIDKNVEKLLLTLEEIEELKN